MNGGMRSEIAVLLRTARAQSGLSQKQARDAIGVSETTLYQWEHGKSMPPLDKAMLLAKTYRMTLSELVGDDPTESNRLAELEARIDRLERD